MVLPGIRGKIRDVGGIGSQGQFGVFGIGCPAIAKLMLLEDLLKRRAGRNEDRMRQFYRGLREIDWILRKLPEMPGSYLGDAHSMQVACSEIRGKATVSVSNR